MTDTQLKLATGTTSTETSKRRSWIPPIPSPLQRLFDSVPLLTYPPNDLPYRSPGPSSLPTLHVFITEEDAAKGSPSFNPSCLKWQTFLRIAGVQVRIVPSTNHASPTGALPFLLPPLTSLTRIDVTTALTPIPSSKLQAYATQHRTTAIPAPTLDSFTSHKLEAYQSLIDTRIRNAWLYALYLSPPNTDILCRLYIQPCSSSSAVQNTLLFQLRRAAAAEIMRSEGRVDARKIYASAWEAFEALETLLQTATATAVASEEGEGEGEERRSGWFFGAEEPTLFDAAVFSYTYLVLRAKWTWADGTLREMLVRQSGLVAHATRILDKYWGDQDQEWTRLYHDKDQK